MTEEIYDDIKLDFFILLYIDSDMRIVQKSCILFYLDLSLLFFLRALKNSLTTGLVAANRPGIGFCF